jgi:hypothetical protein
MRIEERKPTFIRSDKHTRVKQRALDTNQTIFDALDEVIDAGLRTLKIQDIKSAKKHESTKNNNKN